ncbi:uncharacterized protein BX663DRAFT_505142 [Cokeromyces recurvatus]|uniref:uncharacterized protein n=1 Tax=Cokeromyces recurvatus TaxID=90255 RepID=UPI00221FE4BF|nr:uncharacterized protein BX663DRAFT_505142 [Cokeromyces recurvatus]KAI7904473.1 hypothetical protein BX663DRAFT_505142 [Cokeromyces recurvatus]
MTNQERSYLIRWPSICSIFHEMDYQTHSFVPSPPLLVISIKSFLIFFTCSYPDYIYLYLLLTFVFIFLSTKAFFFSS